MKQKLFQKLGAALLAGIMLFGTLSGPLAPLTAAAAAVAEAEAFSAAFADPYAKVGEPMTLDVQGATSAITYKWAVDGVLVSTDSSYTPTEDDLMKWISVNVASGNDTVTLEMFFSELPVLYINTENNAPIVSKEEYINATLTIQGNETYNSETTKLYNGLTEIRGRGNSTWGQPKKPYRLKLDKKTDVFGMGKSKHWVLLANYMDESLQRNTLAYNLSGAMGMEQCSTVFVDVVLNGDFVGNYQFCENIRIDDTRVDIFDWEGFCEDSAGVIADAEGMSKDLTGDLETYMVENMGWITSGSFQFNNATYYISQYPDIEVPSINGGYLIELDEYYDEISKFKTASGQPIMFKSPEYLNTNADMMNFVKTYIQAFEDAVQADTYTSDYDGSTVHYSELFDFDALVDYWLINEIFFNEELNKKSTYMYKDIDGLMLMGPIWDMDWSSGGEGQTYHTEQWATRYYSTNAQANSWYKYLIQDPYFFLKAQERYWEIRNAQVADMLDELDSNYELLKASAKANGERWGYRYDYKKYVDDLRNWFNAHLTWMDEQMATQDSLRDSLGYHPSSRLALTLTDADGKALAADTAKTAPADYAAAIGQSLKLTIQGGNDTNGNAALYVNGRRISVTPTNANSTTIVDVPVESLTAPMGEKNVIEIQIEKPDGTINASRYVTVITTDGVHEHSYETVVTAPTCTEGGYTTYTCECGDSYIADETPALGHTEEIIPGQAPTFDEPGLTEGKKCAVCGETLAEQEETPMLDYNEGIVPIPVLTATAGDWQKGYEGEGPAELVLDDDFGTIWHTDWYGTSRENHWIQFELSESYIVDGLRYKPRQGGSFNGTITAYDIQVSDDGESFRSVASGSWEKDRNWKVVEFEGETVKYVRLVALDAATDNSFVFASAAEIRLTGVKADTHEHSYTAVVTEPTCTEGGYTTYTCSCGDSYIADETPALGHTEEIIPGKDATCTEPGLTEGKKCAVCGEILVVQEEIPALGHTEEIIPGKDATCTETGLTEGKKCSVCGEILVAQEEIAALGHTEEVIPGKAATCTEPGLTEGKKCNLCGEILVAQEEIAPLGHTEEIIPGKDATCTEPGLTEGKKCSVCGEILVAQEEIPTLGHTEEIIPGKDATCTETGLTEGKKCAVCGEILVAQEEIPALGHDWKGTSCQRCDATRENPFTDVPEDSFYIDPVLWAVEKGITTGATETTFNPNGVCQRAAVVTFLWRAAGSPEPTSTNNPFVDVKETDFFYKAVLWAVENEITNGLTTTTFGPYAECNRAQVVTFLWRYLGQPQPTATEHPFTDVAEDQFYFVPMLWAVENGITNGLTETTFGPTAACNRAQVVTFLYRACK